MSMSRCGVLTDVHEAQAFQSLLPWQHQDFSKLIPKFHLQVWFLVFCRFSVASLYFWRLTPRSYSSYYSRSSRSMWGARLWRFITCCAYRKFILLYTVSCFVSWTIMISTILVFLSLMQSRNDGCGCRNPSSALWMYSSKIELRYCINRFCSYSFPKQ